MSLHKSSVLVKLTIRQWDGFKKDRRVTEDVEARYAASNGVGSYNKRLFDKSIMNPIQQIIGKTRQEHARMTMPWCYDGVSLLPSKLLFEYTQNMRDSKDKLDRAVDNLYQQFPIHKANQMSRLGDLFNPDDYPSADELKGKYEVSWSFFPVPQADHFIVDLEAADEAKIKADLMAQLSNTQSEALSELYERVTTLLAHMHERLSDPKNVFRDSLVDNVYQLVEVLPALNVFNDERLTTVCNDLKSKVLICDAQTLRDDLTIRQTVANEAYDLMNVLKGNYREKQAA